MILFDNTMFYIAKVNYQDGNNFKFVVMENNTWFYLIIQCFILQKSITKMLIILNLWQLDCKCARFLICNVYE